MGAFLAGIAGAGKAAGEYRDNLLNVWTETRRNLSDMIKDARDRSVGDPTSYGEFNKLLSQVQTARPGVDQSKLMQRFQELTSLHPTNQKLMQGAGILPSPTPPPQPQAGPAAPGSVPGTPQIPPVMGAAQPSTNPLQGGPMGAPPLGVPTPTAPSMAIPPVTGAPMASVATPPTSPIVQGAGSLNIPSLAQDPMEIYRNVYKEAMADGFLSPIEERTLLPLYQSAITRNEAQAQLEREAKTRFAVGQAQLQELESRGIQVPDIVKAQILTGMQMPIASQTVQPLIDDNVDAKQFASANPGVLESFGIDPTKTASVDIVRNKLTRQIERVLPRFAGTQQFTTTGGQIGLANRATGEVITPGIAGSTQPGLNQPRFGTTASGQTIAISPNELRAGKLPTPVPGMINPAFIPSVTSSVRFQTDTDPVTGMPITIAVPVTQTSRKGGGVAGVGTAVEEPVSEAAQKRFTSSILSGNKQASNLSDQQINNQVKSQLYTTPQGFQVIAKKGLTPLQVSNMAVDIDTMDQAIARFEGIRDRLPMVKDLFTAGKLQLNMNPASNAAVDLIKRALPMTEAESMLAADFISAMEDINKIRQPLGATGFRGEEAFAAMINQVGKPLGDPRVGKFVIQNTIEVAKAINNAKKRTLNPYSNVPPVGAGIAPPAPRAPGVPAAPAAKTLTQDVLKTYLQRFGNDKQKVKAALKQDGYKVE